MKKKLSILLALLLVVCLVFAACSKTEDDAPADDDSTAEPVTFKVGASITPHAEVLEAARADFEAKGYKLEIIEYTDYVQPNLALESGDLDANYFQHQPYLDGFNADHDTHIVTVGTVHYEPIGIYAGKTAALADLPDGAVIAVPNDGTNEARALLLLEANGLIKLAENVGLSATVVDIAENPHNFEIKELEAAQVALALPDADIGVVNGNYAIQAGLHASDALAIEDKDSLAAVTYANILCVKEGNETNQAALDLLDSLHTDAVRDYINNTYDGAVVPTF
jgi:D-methionine transport system substrate-binding protein